MNKKVLCALLAPALVVGISTLWPDAKSASTSAPAAAPTQAAAPAPAPEAPKAVEPLELQTAVEQGAVKVEFAGNGRQRLDAKLTNLTAGPLKIKAEAGQMLASGKNQIVVVRPVEAEAAAGETIQFSIQTAATRSSNKVADAVYLLSYSQPPRIAALLAHLQTRAELSPGAIQTAVLALTENLPLNAVSKFTPSTVGLKSRFNTDAFRVESYDIVTALTALREIGVPDASIAMTIDPQLKIESMIDPLARAAAMRYYAISAETEWDFWKTELLSGDPSTRHYALYGIARFYPQVALEMLPKWARQVQTGHVYRLSAIQALADTQRPEALNILNELSDELGSETELGRAARSAAEYLDVRLGQIAVAKNAVAFRASERVTQF